MGNLENLKRWLRMCVALAACGAAAAFAQDEASEPPKVQAVAPVRPAPVTTPALPDAFDDPDDVPLPDPDLWQRIRIGFSLYPLDFPLVNNQVERKLSRPA